MKLLPIWQRFCVHHTVHTTMHQFTVSLHWKIRRYGACVSPAHLAEWPMTSNMGLERIPKQESAQKVEIGKQNSPIARDCRNSNWDLSIMSWCSNHWGIPTLLEGILPSPVWASNVFLILTEENVVLSLSLCKKTSSLLHYPRKIKFIHSFIHSFSLSLCIICFVPQRKGVQASLMPLLHYRQCSFCKEKPKIHQKLTLDCCIITLKQVDFTTGCTTRGVRFPAAWKVSYVSCMGKCKSTNF